MTPPRADAARNRRSLLDSASVLFATQGPDVPLEAVAAHAGVSIATLYRNFAQRDELVAATFQREIDALGDVAPLLDDGDAAAALAAWVDRFADYSRTKRALAEVLHAMPESTRPTARDAVVGALERILAAGAEDGTLRTDLDADDVIAALAGLWSLPPGDESEARARRLSRFVVAGLRAP